MKTGFRIIPEDPTSVSVEEEISSSDYDNLYVGLFTKDLHPKETEGYKNYARQRIGRMSNIINEAVQSSGWYNKEPIEFPTCTGGKAIIDYFKIITDEGSILSQGYLSFFFTVTKGTTPMFRVGDLKFKID